MDEIYVEDTFNYSPVYPGYVLTVGSSGSNVYIMQSYLNAIREELYHKMNKLVVDGKFGNGTKTTVMQYQAIKSLKIDGKIGPKTWNTIVEEYNQLPVPHTDDYPGYVQRPGMSGVHVDNMQSKLNVICTVYPGVCHQVQDGKYGSKMSCSVRMFQRHFGLSIDGLIGQHTWDKIVEIYHDVMNDYHPEIHTKFDGVILSTGSQCDEVRMVQGMLNSINKCHCDNHENSVLKVDGIFGSGTKRAVSTFQAKKGLKIDGKVGQNTWNKMIEAFNISIK